MKTSYVALIATTYWIKQALYYATERLLAGTYYFDILATYDTEYNNLITCWFTLTKAMPTGG